MEQPPRKHLDDPANFDDGKSNRTCPVGTIARFATNGGGRPKTQLRRLCVCDQSKDAVNKESPTYPGHWASTQGNSLQSNTHKNTGVGGSTFARFKVGKVKASAYTSAKGKGPVSAATSSTSATVAEADLKRAAAHIEHLKDQIKELGESRGAGHRKYVKATELANTQLNLQAQKTNEMTSEHAKVLRSSQIETDKAIAKIHEIRGHAEGFAENMLAKATEGHAPDLVKTWAAFSGVLTSEAIEAADWGIARQNVQGPCSVNVFNIAGFQGHESPSPPTPMQHTVHQLTVAKVLAQPTPDGYQALVSPSAALMPWATGASAAGKKRKREDEDEDDDSDAASSEFEHKAVAAEEYEDDDDGGSS